MKAYGGADVYIHIFFTSVLAGGKWSASRPGRFTPGETAPPYPLDRRLGGPQYRSGRSGEEKIHSDPSVVQHVAGRSTDHSIAAPSCEVQTGFLHMVFFCGVGLTPPLGPFFRSPRFRFLRSLCSSPLGPCKSQHCGHTLAYCAFPAWYMRVIVE
jgi:hypothetical protein